MRGERSVGTRSKKVALLGLFVLVQDPLETFTPKAPFAVADTREVRELLQQADRYLSDGSWPLGLAKLQEVIEEHPSELFPSPTLKGVFVGAAHLAEEWIDRLPSEAREVYQSSYGPPARALLAQTREGQRDLLLRVVQRYGKTQEGRRALLLLGELALEQGHWAESERLFRRCLKGEGGSPDPEVLLRLGYLFKVRGQRGALEGLIPDAGTEISFLGRRTNLLSLLQKWLAETPPNPAFVPEFQGLQAPSPRQLPPTPTGLDKPAWRYSERDGVFQHPFHSELGVPDPAFNLHPTVEEDRLLFSDSIGVFALDLYTGKERWRYPGPAGWERIPEREKRNDFFGSGANPNVCVAGAASQGICVFPLQVPLKLHENEQFQGIPIRTIIPTRRLFAFDAESGRILWSHWRPELARLGMGEIVDRTSVATPPIVAGGRVYAGIYRMEGKIDFYVACFDLKTGRTLWKTPVVTGQLELNMFGRPIREFAGSPLLLDGGNLYFATNLGVCASADAESGRLRWVSRYDQIFIGPALSYQRNPRVVHWANQPPVHGEGILFVTPLDSEYLYAIRPETGEVLARRFFNQVDGSNRYNLGLRHLLGVAEGKLFLSGTWLVALAAREGLGAAPYSPVWRPRQILPNEISKSSQLPRGVLTDRGVLVPTLDGILTFSLEDGSPAEEFASWQATSRDRGNLAVAGGILLALSDLSIEARFDWDSLLVDARRTASSGGPEALERLGRLLRRRGDSLAQAGKAGYEKAIEAFAEASRILERLLELGRPDAAGELSDLYLSLGEMELGRKNFAEAEAHFRRAQAKAPGPQGRLQALLRLTDLQREWGPRKAFDNSLAELERDFAGERRRIDGKGEIPVGLYVQLLRHQTHLARQEEEAAVRVLQEILRQYGLESLENESAADFARDAIADLLRAKGRELYAPYESQAQERLDSALESRDRAALLELIRLYPNAAVVAKAYRALAEISLEADDPETVVSVCRRYLALETSPEGRASMLRRMAAAFERAGNPPFAEGLLRKLGALYPDLTSDFLSDGGKTFAELARPPLPLRPSPGPRPPLSPGAETTVAYSSLLVLTTLGERATRLGYYLAAADGELRCYRPTEPEGLAKPLWRVTLDAESGEEPLAALTGKTLTVAAGRTVQGLSLETGARRWIRTISSPIHEAFSRNGVFLYTLKDRKGNFRSEAVDALLGIPLWSIPLPWERPPLVILGEGEVTFQPPAGAADESMEIYDLWTGLAELKVSPPRLPEVLGGAIASGVLILAYPPAISRNVDREDRSAMLRGYPLRSQLGSWRAEIPSKYGIHSLLFAEEKPYLLLDSRDPREEEGGAVCAIYPEEGRFSILQTFPKGAIFPGLFRNLTNAADQADFLVIHPEAKGFLKAVLLDLGTGKILWKRTLPHTVSQLAEGEFPPSPVLTADLLFLPLKTHRPTAAGSRVEVMVLDRHSSEPVGTSFSLGEMPPNSENPGVEITALPGALVIQKGLNLRLFRGSQR